MYAYIGFQSKNEIKILENVNITQKIEYIQILIFTWATRSYTIK